MLKLQFKDRRRESVWLVDTKFSIGKSNNNSLMIDDPSIESSHAEIVNQQDQLRLVRKHPKAEIKVNGNSISSDTALNANDLITLGTVELELVDAQTLASTNNSKSAPIWSIYSSASWLEKNNFVINKKTIIGRDPGCDICLNLDYLSRQHVSLEPQNGNLLIEDLNSSNGTFVNGERIHKSKLEPGDKIKLDVLTFEVRGPSGKAASDPHKTIIRTAPAPSALKSTSSNETAINKDNTTQANIPKARPQRKKLASEGKQAWISGENQLKAKVDRNKGKGGLLFLLLGLTVVAGGLAFLLTQ